MFCFLFTNIKCTLHGIDFKFLVLFNVRRVMGRLQVMDLMTKASMVSNQAQVALREQLLAVQVMDSSHMLSKALVRKVLDSPK